jgi:G3E family GTPase
MDLTPVHIISGFLGAGKTTAIIRLLENSISGEKWAVIVNEFGRISIDGQTLQASKGEAQIYEVSGGCICCSSRDYFRENLQQIAGGEFSGIIVEPSGLGGIEMVSETVRQMPGLALQPVICLVDITMVDHPRFKLNPVYQAQVRKSDAIVFSKCDLIHDKEQLDFRVDIFKLQLPGVVYHEPGTLPEALIKLPGKAARKNDNQKLSAVPDLTDSNFCEFEYVYSAEKVIDTEMLGNFLHNYPGILRAKGHIRTKSGWNLVNYTLSGCNFVPCGAKERNEIVVIAGRKSEGYYPAQNIALIFGDKPV